MLEPKLIHFTTKDNLELPGLLFHAAKSTKAAIFLHGNGSSSVFYGKGRAEYAEELAKKGVSLLSFNNRGAHYITKLEIQDTDDDQLFGMAYEIIKDCIQDIDAAVLFLKQQGFNEFYLIGESTGANKICIYHFYKPENPISKYVLLGGGDDVGIYYDMYGPEKFWPLLEKARQQIKKGNGQDIICELLPGEIFSYKGFFDIANPDGDYNVFPFYEVLRKTMLSRKQELFKMYKSLNKPSLVIYGENDEYAWGNVSKIIKILKEYQPQLTYKIIKNADHSFHNHRKKVGKIIAEWLA
ncbi:hypothetical protein A3H80_03640 [Candidatus Roizmanbacteria bacterium RIFCSPLOWO2_02_FULL_37_19]|uniref:Uncharacterized protein n=1 Tax=Candidatus Roizmanbacteria bacterium RIFCSPHIGHO2_02_FULL_37_24 TaxID=1802037 RepID=A0A1F7GWI0_9BACT|nr:MAG: hypothetical protein A2862_04590 [Candidatus Roizmanbacteria bacterium RIFCSPHIGHO2_01_FULL_38_41]OGK22936.1 MAG: hypothetical protein A3C24_03700 [Candidatus Roizmanbacteria bacterium RIFCSPHIGHO2_02_FULL_37_24]OGK33610.1 MAG: hypothetical protein A3E10_05085 [Candidatus Roizmanbacteria bacterium RIFCSPHIGHO2_12_FULL_37_23]OGK44185.1 MAG: hypothetical protein A2956_00795 [Candidatus Roizmanbacteria bacterium RIFCSPLOWO2_01_FULL_37_57]OGK55262.1 MAG: hypothetical protein A3H80_03640 [Ca